MSTREAESRKKAQASKEQREPPNQVPPGKAYCLPEEAKAAKKSEAPKEQREPPNQVPPGKAHCLPEKPPEEQREPPNQVPPGKAYCLPEKPYDKPKAPEKPKGACPLQIERVRYTAIEECNVLDVLQGKITGLSKGNVVDIFKQMSLSGRLVKMDLNMRIFKILLKFRC